MIKASWHPYTLKFYERAITSRNSMTRKRTALLRIVSDEIPTEEAIGEIAMFEGLSREDSPHFAQLLDDVCTKMSGCQSLADLPEVLPEVSSVRFGVESALLRARYYPCQEKIPRRLRVEGIPINGLIWMGDKTTMRRRIREKIDAGFQCVKLKIGGIDFEDELDLLRAIRSEFSANEIEIRLDANGGFTPFNALERLNRLAQFDIHSLEQPIAAGQWEAMCRICAESPIPIALDEELIGYTPDHRKAEMLATIRPHYIILKPSLCGGLAQADSWIEACRQAPSSPGWWATSALESNIGLEAIALWITEKDTQMPQGLGTGHLYSNNFPSSLSLKADRLYIPTAHIGERTVNIFDSNSRRVGNIEWTGSEVTPGSQVIYLDADPKVADSISRFIREWESPSSYIIGHTSGSTGSPKEIHLQKADMKISAEATNRHFNITSGSRLLCPLSIEYIAGKMMAVRGIMSGAQVLFCKPSNSFVHAPEVREAVFGGPRITLLSVVPSQCAALIADPEFTARIDNVIIGGAPLDPAMQQQLIDLSAQTGCTFYATYGMTETCSHVALRKLDSDYFEAMPGISFETDGRDCLKIIAPKYSFKELITNDIVEICSPFSFKWIGRADNVINTGGIKIFPEQIEKKLAQLPAERFYISSEKDAKWGHRPVMVTDLSPEQYSDIALMEMCRTRLSGPEMPARVIRVQQLSRTQSGKLIRRL